MNNDCDIVGGTEYKMYVLLELIKGILILLNWL
jgi:hypothetical protein